MIIYFTNQGDKGYLDYLKDAGIKHVMYNYADIRKMKNETEQAFFQGIKDSNISLLLTFLTENQSVQINTDNSSAAEKKKSKAAENPSMNNSDSPTGQNVYENGYPIACLLRRPGLTREIDDYIRLCIVYNVPQYGECDLYNRFGYDAVCEVRKVFKNRGLKPILIVKKEMSKDEVEDTIFKSIEFGNNYISLPGDWETIDYRRWFAKYNDLLKQHKIKVHSWSNTRNESIFGIPFYSVDSSTWMGGGKFGMIYHFNKFDNNMRYYDHSQRKVALEELSAHFFTAGLSLDKIAADDRDEITKWNILQWNNLSVYMSQYTNNAYWMTEKEKTEIILSNKPTNTSIYRETNYPLVGSNKALNIMRSCDNCYLADRCPEYNKDGTCSFSYPIVLETPENMVDMLKTILSLAGKRLISTMAEETVSGAPANKELNDYLKKYFEMVKIFKEVVTRQNSVSITGNGDGVDLIGKIFGSMITGNGSRVINNNILELTKAANPLQNEEDRYE